MYGDDDDGDDNVNNDVGNDNDDTNDLSTITPCQICHTNPKLYKCPRCSCLTCSLQCCKQHKVPIIIITIIIIIIIIITIDGIRM